MSDLMAFIPGLAAIAVFFIVFRWLAVFLANTGWFD